MSISFKTCKVPGLGVACSVVAAAALLFLGSCFPDLETFYKDADGDGYGGTETKEAETAPPGYVAKSGDCDDTDKAVYPGASEECNGKDDDCDHVADDGLAMFTYFKDGDGDTYGSWATARGCKAPPGFVSAHGDCNDSNSAVHPGAAEKCNGRDDDCDGLVDEGVVKERYYQDLDGDGFGGQFLGEACSKSGAVAVKGGDCNDYHTGVFPGAAEQCDGLDNDCDQQVDEGVTTKTYYKDLDDDGWAPANAPQKDACVQPPGYVPPMDQDSDKTIDWDCNDFEKTVYPGAPTVCGDGLDNDCSGITDHLCFTPCPGKWGSGPFALNHAYIAGDAATVDLNGDGKHEVVVHNHFGFAVLDTQGQVLHQHSLSNVGLNYHWGGARAVAADIDDYDTFGKSIQTLELLTATGYVPTFYKLQDNKKVIKYTSTEPIFSQGLLMARDLNRDGKVVFFASYGAGTKSTKMFRFDKSKKKIVFVNHVPEPASENTSRWWDGRSLTDLNGDGVPELVFGSGHADHYQTWLWVGKLTAHRFLNPVTLTSTKHCDFDTTQSGLHPAAVSPLYSLDVSGTGEIRTRVVYFKTKIKHKYNVRTDRYWRYDPKTCKSLDKKPSTSNNLWKGTTDLDHNGVPEDHGRDLGIWGSYGVGLFDVNGDGYPDRIYSSNGELRLELWRKGLKDFKENKGSRRGVSAKDLYVRSAWDVNADGRLEVISTDMAGNVYCHSLGQKSWHRYSSLPPRFTMFSRTFQWDNHEPNEGKKLSGGVPTDVAWIPSALTAKGDLHGYLSSAKDRDYYKINPAWDSHVCLRAPKGKQYKLKVYSYLDRWSNKTRQLPADGKPDGLIWEQATPAGGEVCFHWTRVYPYRGGEYKLVIGVEPKGAKDYSPYWPYWIEARK